jgi:hypothetical protein
VMKCIRMDGCFSIESYFTVITQSQMFVKSGKEYTTK